MKILVLLFSIAFAATPSLSQNLDEPVATYTGGNITARQLSPRAQQAFARMPELVGETRKQLFSQRLGSYLLEKEAAALKTTVSALIKAQTAKVKDPTEAQIKEVYDANQQQIGGRPLSELRSQIIEYIRHEPEQKAVGTYLDSLTTKYKVVKTKDVNAADLKPTDALFTVGSFSLTANQFDESIKLGLFNAQAEIYDELYSEIDEAVYNAVLAEEAKALNINSGDLVAREITSKMKDFSDAEFSKLQDTFRSKLFEKYKVKILVTEPQPPVMNVSADDDPSRGPGTAPATVIMFSDLQCSACAAVHPILRHVIAGYGDKVRFVVRDFPLESIHDNAFRAAKAANAAHAQGKFFEYSELLYTRQDALDAASLRKYAAELGLNVKQFDIDFNSEKTASEVRKDMADGEALGISSTPAIFVNGVPVRSFSANGFRRAIDRALNK